MESLIEATTIPEGSMVGKCSIVKHVILEKGVKIWHYCNLYATEEEPISIGKNTQIGSYTEIKAGVNIKQCCRIQSQVFIPEGVTIEKYVFIGPNVIFTNDKHPTALKAIHQSWKLEHTTVKEYASIGAKAVIGPGITIGKHAVIGMGSVVTKNVPEYAIVCGNPANQIGDIRDEHYASYFLNQEEENL